MTIAYITCSCLVRLIDRPIAVAEGMHSLRYNEYKQSQATDNSQTAENFPKCASDWICTLYMLMDFGFICHQQLMIQPVNGN